MNAVIFDKLRDILGPEYLAISPEERICYSYDGSRQSFLPDAVAFPEKSQQIRQILLLANEHRFPVIPRGAGTGMTGGALPVQGGLVLALSRMNRILEIDADNMIAVVEPGVMNGDLQKAAARHNLFFAPDPASFRFCTVGGNAAECAGGPRAIKYGVTRDHVLGMEVVLPTGDILQTGVRTEKGVVGYDLTRLFLGSEGTLGIFTRLILRLLPRPEVRSTFLLLFDAIGDATSLVSRIMQEGLVPATLEYMDQTAIRIVRDQVEGIDLDQAAALLLLELDGSRQEVTGQEQRLITLLQHRCIPYRHASDTDERDRLWQARRRISPASFTLRPHKISEDVVVPRSRIGDLVDWVTAVARRLDLIILTFGHAGDGNIHVNIMVDKHDTDEYQRGLAAREQLFVKVIDLGGTLSGEHGIGITKSASLPLEVDPVALTTMHRIKNLFDPLNILNPGKIFPPDQR